MSSQSLLAGLVGAASSGLDGQPIGAHETEDLKTSTVRNQDGTAPSSNIPHDAQFAKALRSPIIEILVGTGDTQVKFLAHEALLLKSPYFASAIIQLEMNTKSISFDIENLEAMSAFLEFLYTNEYYPRISGGGLEGIAESVKDDGGELLRHARVYTLAHKFEMDHLKTLAHTKILLVDSTAQGEIAYARYIYANTPKDDVTIRDPIVMFWGQQSHVLRHEVEADFQSLCTDIPEFAFDVLNYVLDVRERKSNEKKRERESSGPLRGDTPRHYSFKRSRHR